MVQRTRNNAKKIITMTMTAAAAAMPAINFLSKRPEVELAAAIAPLVGAEIEEVVAYET